MEQEIKITKKDVTAILNELKERYESEGMVLRYANAQRELADYLYKKGTLNNRLCYRGDGYGPSVPERELAFYVSPTAYSKLRSEVEEEQRSREATSLNLYIPIWRREYNQLFIGDVPIMEDASIEGDDIILGIAKWDACALRLNCTSRFDELIEEV